jgi:hypothetical protein
MYAKVENGQVVQVGLPSSGALSDGRSVSNYSLLPESVLLTEGWLPLELNEPEYNPAIQELQLVDYTIEAARVIANYEAVALSEPEPTVQENKDSIISLSTDFMGFMDWYFETHPDEA